jgi:hypothetical protein
VSGEDWQRKEAMRTNLSREETFRIALEACREI